MNLKSYIFLIAPLGLATSAAADSFLFLAAAKASDLVSYRIDPQSGVFTWLLYTSYHADHPLLVVPCGTRRH